MIDWILKYWPLLVGGAGLVASAAVGDHRIRTLEESAKAQQTQAVEIRAIEVHQATLTAQQEAIRADIEDNRDDLKANQAILIQILQKVQ